MRSLSFLPCAALLPFRATGWLHTMSLVILPKFQTRWLAFCSSAAPFWVSFYTIDLDCNFVDTLNLFWFYLMFKIVLSTTPAIKPLMEKKKIEFTLAKQEFHERMQLMRTRNREKLSTFKSSVASSMTGITPIWFLVLISRFPNEIEHRQYEAQAKLTSTRNKMLLPKACTSILYTVRFLSGPTVEVVRQCFILGSFFVIKNHLNTKIFNCFGQFNIHFVVSPTATVLSDCASYQTNMFKVLNHIVFATKIYFYQ